MSSNTNTNTNTGPSKEIRVRLGEHVVNVKHANKAGAAKLKQIVDGFFEFCGGEGKADPPKDAIFVGLLQRKLTMQLEDGREVKTPDSYLTFFWAKDSTDVATTKFQVMTETMLKACRWSHDLDNMIGETHGICGDASVVFGTLACSRGTHGVYFQNTDEEDTDRVFFIPKPK